MPFGSDYFYEPGRLADHRLRLPEIKLGPVGFDRMTRKECKTRPEIFVYSPEINQSPLFPKNVDEKPCLADGYEREFSQIIKKFMELMHDSNTETDTVKPFLKWAGGKRWFVQQHSDLIPERFDRYIEPFLGSGAVFFHLKPKHAILGDLSAELIETYSAIRDNWKLVHRYLCEHHRNHSKSYYYKVRSSEKRSLESRAARFIYLNRTCWNGLYRVNLNGKFNVPIGTKTTVIFEDDDFSKVSEALQFATLACRDFEYLIDEAKEGDLVFIDPPYTVRHNYNAFVKYNEKLFSWGDQERLFYAVKRAQSRGAFIVGTNAYHSSVRKLYHGTFKTQRTSRVSAISSKTSTRSRFEELIIYTGK